jgi:acyl-CoA reductase-like NAD-dependent aldehyde dehydrogenase
MSVTVQQLRNLGGGEFVDAVDGGTADILNPATGEPIPAVPRGTQADVDRAVEAARKAWPEWRESTPAERAELLRVQAVRLRQGPLAVRPRGLHAGEARDGET